MLEVLAAYTCLSPLGLLACLFAEMRGMPGSTEMRDLLMRLGNVEPNLFREPVLPGLE